MQNAFKAVWNWLKYESPGGPDFADAPMPNWMGILVLVLINFICYLIAKTA